MLESRIEQRRRKRRKRRRKGKNPSNSHFVALKFEEKEEKSVGWCKNYGNSCTVWSKAVEIFKRIRKGQGWASPPFCGRLERGDIRGNSLFRFCDSRNISSLCFLWVRRWPLMNNDVLSRFHILDVGFWYYKNIHCFDSIYFDMEIVIQIR